MNFEELYNQAMSGDDEALNELNHYTDSGNAEAQFVLSCVYDNPDSPFVDVNLGMHWLQKSARNKFESAIRKIKELSPDFQEQYGVIDKSEDAGTNVKPGGVWSFQGRIDRTTYLVYSIVYVFVFTIAFYLLNKMEMMWIDIIARLVFAYLSLTLCVKRMHDCGHSGWWVLIPFCPLALLFMKGEDKANMYGPR